MSPKTIRSFKGVKQRLKKQRRVQKPWMMAIQPSVGKPYKELFCKNPPEYYFRSDSISLDHVPLGRNSRFASRMMKVVRKAGLSRNHRPWNDNAMSQKSCATLGRMFNKLLSHVIASAHVFEKLTWPSGVGVDREALHALHSFHATCLHSKLSMRIAKIEHIPLL